MKDFLYVSGVYLFCEVVKTTLCKKTGRNAPQGVVEMFSKVTNRNWKELYIIPSTDSLHLSKQASTVLQ